MKGTSDELFSRAVVTGDEHSGIRRGNPIDALHDITHRLGNRLRIVEERTGGPTVVDLGHSLSSAPSWAALGWLETSIRSYAKFVDVAARATGGADDEAAVMRRERMAIDEISELIDEMKES